MAFRKIYDGLRIIAKVLSTGTKLGDLEAIDSDSDGEGIVTLHNGDTTSQVLTADHSASVKNKTLDDTNTLNGVTIIDPEFEAEELTLKEIASPSNPSAGEHKLYVNENNSDLEIKDSSGNITKFVEQVSFTADVVYGTDNSENETTIGYSASATSNKIIQRDSNASAKVDILSDSDMSANGSDITNRNYVRRKVIVDSNDTTATEGGSLSIPTNTNSNVYYINANSDLNSYTITLPNLKGYVDYNKAYEYSFIFSTTINSLTISTQGGSSLNFFINHAQAGDSFSIVFDEDNNLWYLKDQYSRNLNEVQAEHIAVRLLDGTETTLPTGTVTVDGQSVIVEDVVLFTNLSSDPGVYRAKGTIGDNTITGWDQVSCFRGVGSPVAGDEVFVRAGTVYANTLHTYDGSSWSDTSTDKADTDLGNLTSTSINQDLLPDTTNTRDLGSSSKAWTDVWATKVVSPSGSTATLVTEDATSSTNSNDTTVASGSTVDGTSGQMTAKSGDTSGNGSSNFATLRSGNVTGTSSSGNSGITTVRSGNVSGVSSTGDSGNVVVKSGDVAGSGDSGNVTIYSGSSAGGSRGTVNLQGNGILLDSLGQGVDVDNDNIINVADPVNAQDAATKNYTDTLVENPTIEVATFDGQSSTPTNPSAGNYKVYVDDNTQKLTILDSNGNATQIGGGGQGGINYISNYDAEVNTDGWTSTRRVIEGLTNGTSETFSTGASANPYTFTTNEPLIAFSNLGDLTNGTTYYARTGGSDETELASTVGGSALNLSTRSNSVAVSPNFSGFYSGSSVSTWTRSTSSPLRGDASFLLTKPASLAVGDVHYYAFTIDSADQAKVMQITFDYSVVSGTYATGDVIVRIRDVTNGTVIQPSGYQIENVGVASVSRMTFQTASNSTSYELIFNIASVSTSAYTLKFDNIQLGPQVVPLGAPVTDWVSFTPLWQSNGTAPALGNGTLTGRWRQVGGAADIEIRLNLGSTSTTGTGTSFITWPSFMDLQPLNGSFSEGTCFMYTNTTATSRSGTPQFYNTERRFGVYLSEVGQWGGANTDWGGAGDTITITVRGVPVVGWSSSTVVSSSANTRVIALQATGNPSNAIGGTFGTMTWSSVTTRINKGGINFNPSTGEITLPVPGTYKFSAVSQVARTSGTATQYLALEARNTTTSTSYGMGASYWLTSGAEGNTVNGETLVEANAGDVVVFRIASQGSGLSYANTLTGTFINVEYLNGPSQIAMSEVIACRYTVPSAGSFSADTAVVYGTKDYDTHNAYNSTTGIFTAPAPGFYELDAKYLTTVITQSTSGAVQVFYSKNGGAQVRMGWTLGSGASANQWVSGNDTIHLLAGDTVQFKVSSSTTATMNSGSMTIKRMGGM